MGVISGRGVRCSVSEANPNPEPITLEKATVTQYFNVYKPKVVPIDGPVTIADPAEITYITDAKVIQQKPSVILNPEMATPAIITTPCILKDRND